ncbi:hypothetical protein A3A71_04045 [Candidatus Berkelbacteria bacterium RIFCSPLOWO2_01_FULL_50_28]|uniref:Uncharacterized protein n=1 Tax=Candidatus Berkelbacteria bacterium RIFCSPLOWO2_01_FULL_50_28 TaxID=1797471 RepID=A0A1F5EA63_9BACT|nr:MAG: hypothetical protein A2807_03565 [Candidatus Berkelbacteria bacterium RIFCSPHIGHO2_01_FULL_50_36]OGD63118.1 MAG: hypothetical protein A3F39_01410 [Candidatus Berkelbacteria bacterium RIFCSPHIGHO2_12_FULL_50_11]OGD64309.1 MAG: hypothetical protein A3A71_04045 [Candidatus Berkelbacteria bacterium RIFCSPLOWO2_01_FULL_50_28]
MPRPIRIILLVAFLLLVGGIIWGVVASRDSKKAAMTNTSKDKNLIGTPVTRTTEPKTTKNKNKTVSKKPIRSLDLARGKQDKQVAKRFVWIITTYEEIYEVSFSEASASAGVSSDGSAWAVAQAW